MPVDMNDEFNGVNSNWQSVCLSHFPGRVTELDFLDFAHEDFAVGAVVTVAILKVLSVGHHSEWFAGWAVLFRLFGREGKSVAFYVGLHPKVGEQEKE